MKTAVTDVFDQVGAPIVDPTAENIELAAAAILDGKMVCIPTETVYGVAVDATNPEAVAKLFEAKGRPQNNPLIVHISDFVQLEDVVGEWSDAADLLANRFWPGPLTLVVKKSELIPDIVTGGLDTVAVRMPDHPVALELIEACGVPLAAPSANRFMQLSPTSADMVSSEIAEQVELILDGGQSRIGVESTVVDVSDDSPRILRPGGISRGDIQAALGRPLGSLPPNGVRRSPGMYARHYAPKATVNLVETVEADQAGLVFSAPTNERQIRMPGEPIAYAAAMYSALHLLDSMGASTIYVELPPDEGAWEAVFDRLRRAVG